MNASRQANGKLFCCGPFNSKSICSYDWYKTITNRFIFLRETFAKRYFFYHTLFQIRYLSVVWSHVTDFFLLFIYLFYYLFFRVPYPKVTNVIILLSLHLCSSLSIFLFVPYQIGKSAIVSATMSVCQRLLPLEPQKLVFKIFIKLNFLWPLIQQIRNLIGWRIVHVMALFMKP